MESINSTAAQALRVLLDGQPTTPAKVAFAWRMAAGPAMARGAEADWIPSTGVLHLHARTPAWLKEIRIARPILTTRVRELVGPDVIKKIVID